MISAVITGKDIRDGLVDDIIDYENGDLDYDATIAMFQKLINNGMAWTLQGHYGRTARDLIESGECMMPREDS